MYLTKDYFCDLFITKYDTLYEYDTLYFMFPIYVWRTLHDEQYFAMKIKNSKDTNNVIIWPNYREN